MTGQGTGRAPSHLRNATPKDMKVTTKMTKATRRPRLPPPTCFEAASMFDAFDRAWAALILVKCFCLRCLKRGTGRSTADRLFVDCRRRICPSGQTSSLGEPKSIPTLSLCTAHTQAGHPGVRTFVFYNTHNISTSPTSAWNAKCDNLGGPA